MLKIEILGKEGGFLDVKPGTNSPFTISAQEIRKPAEKKGTFSKTVTLAETKNNGEKLGFLFNIDVISGNFDVNKRVNVRLFNDNTEIEGNFYLQLTKIKKRGQRVTGYEVSLKDEVGDFFGLISQNYLHDLDFSDGNHFLTGANVIAGMDHNQGDAVYTYHLTANSDNNYQLKQFKPAFFALDIWDRIHARAGKSYEWVNKNDDKTKFSNWIIPSNTDPISGTEEQALIRATRGSWTVTKTGTGKPAALSLEPIIVDTEVLDVAGNYNPVTGIFTSPVNVPTGTSVLFNLKFNYKLEIVNNEAETITLHNPGGINTLEFFPRITGRKNGALFGQTPIPINGNIYTTGATIPASSSVTVADQQVNISLSLSNFLTTDAIGIANRLNETYGAKVWRKSGAVNASVSHRVTITGITLEIKPNAGNGYGFGQFIELNKFLPRQVKQSDFIAAIMTLNNLIVDKERTTENKIVYVKRDEYYDAGEVKKWKLDTSREYDITFVNEQTAKRQILTYKQDDDEANKGYEAQTGEIYGQVEYTFKSEFNRGIEKTEVIFSPTPVAGTTFGAVVPLFSGVNPETNIRLLYKGDRLPCAPYKITEYSGSVLTITDGYPYAGHFDDPIEPNLDLNFSVCDYYFYPWLLRKTNNNMFSLNWRRHFSQIDNGKILTGFFHLTPLDIKNLKLNDKIFVLNQYWNINKVIDFDPNSGSALTKCELITVEDLAKIKTRTRFPFVLGSGGGIIKPVRGVIKKLSEQLNSLPAFGEVLVIGKNANISDTVKNAVIVGDDVEASEDGVYTPKIVFPDGSEIATTTDLPDTNIYNTDGVIDATIERVVDINGKVLRFENGQFVVGAAMGSSYLVEINGDSEAKRALYAKSNGLVAVRGEDASGVALYGQSNNGISLYGNATGTGVAAHTLATTNGSISIWSVGTSLIEETATAVLKGSVIHEVRSTTRAAIPAPIMTTAEKNAITPTHEGGMVYDRSRKRPEFHNGATWQGMETRFIQIQHAQFNPANSQKVAFGKGINAPANATLNYYEIKLQGNGVINGVYLNMQVGGVLGAAQNWSLFLRHNGIDYLVATLNITTVVRIFENYSMNIPYVDGDIVRMIYVNPNWGASPPTVVTAAGHIIAR